MWWAILLTAVLTSLLTLAFLNLRAGEKQIRYQLTHRFSVTDPQFLRCMGQLLGPGILPGNRIIALHNGDQIFPAMLAAIRGARKSITFETYIYWSGEIGRTFCEAFCERAQAGVQVHVMLDWAGSGDIEAKYLDELKAAGVEVELYHSLRRPLCRATVEGVRGRQGQMSLDDARGIQEPVRRRKAIRLVGGQVSQAIKKAAISIHPTSAHGTTPQTQNPS